MTISVKVTPNMLYRTGFPTGSKRRKGRHIKIQHELEKSYKEKDIWESNRDRIQVPSVCLYQRGQHSVLL